MFKLFHLLATADAANSEPATGCYLSWYKIFWVLCAVSAIVIVAVIIARKRRGIGEGKGETTAQIRKEKEKAMKQQAKETQEQSEENADELSVEDKSFEDAEV